MRFQFFAIPARHPEEATAGLNTFLASHRVCTVTRELIPDGANSFWSVCVEWTSSELAEPPNRKNQVDYRKILPPEQFEIFTKLRDLRKQLAERDGVPPYALFKNEHLAEMIRQQITSGSALQKLDGVGPSKMEKYGEPFLSLLRKELPIKAATQTQQNDDT